MMHKHLVKIYDLTWMALFEPDLLTIWSLYDSCVFLLPMIFMMFKFIFLTSEKISKNDAKMLESVQNLSKSVKSRLVRFSQCKDISRAGR